MKKSFAICLAAVLSLALFAVPESKGNAMKEKKSSPVPETVTWRLFAGENLPDGLFDHGETVGDALNLPDGRTIAAKPFAFPASGIADMWAVLGYKPKSMSRTVLVADFDEPEAATRLIGFGCDWELELRLNGKKIASTRKRGNGESRINPSNHVLEIQTQKGHNQIVYELFGGDASFDVAFQFLNMPSLALRFAPWVDFPDASRGAVSIVFAANRKAPAGIDYRRCGEAEWIRIYDNLGGQIRRDRAEHVIRLENLAPDADYEYRLVLLDECYGMKEVTLPEIYRFHTAPVEAKAFSFVTTSDLQILAVDRAKYLKILLNRPDSKAADFFAFVGDVSWTSDFDLDVVEGFVMPFRNVDNGAKTLVMVRGNHEIYGADTNRFFSYFNAPEPGREGYTMFRWGDTCFFVLDFCDDTGRRPEQSSRALHDFEPYIAKEAAWLKRMVESTECRTAKYRIVLAHGLPVGDLQKYMPKHVHQVIDPVFGGANPKCRIHLWIGGHVHYPLRSIPNANAWYASMDLVKVRKDLPPPERIGERYPFTVAVHSGPSKRNPPELQISSMLVKVSEAGIEVQSFDREGVRYDHFTVHEDGTVENGERAAWFQKFDY